jgi:cell division protease FtsH
VLRLLERETLGREELEEIFKQVRKVPPRPAHTGSGKRKPSTRPPVMTPAELELLGEGDLKAIRRANGRKQPAAKVPASVRRVAAKPAPKDTPRRRTARGGATEPGA